MAKNLVIVESPAKSKTISKFLGKDYVVLASMGHIRDLPKSTMGIDIEKDFKPKYAINPDKKSTIKKLKDEIDAKTVVWLATDEDREGEAIGWHLLEALKIKNNPTHRIVFHEITKTAIDNAIANPRQIDENLVDAQQARRILDRLVGYELSPLLWKKVRYGLSAGRVQSVAARLVVERERAIQAFEPVEFWRIKALTETNKKENILFELLKEDGKKIHIKDEAQAKGIEKLFNSSPFVISNIEKKKVKQYPSPPFITSTLQQEASRKLGFSVKKTMVVAQQLYEGINLGSEQVGLITYMRTDSFNLAAQALESIKSYIQNEYGKEYALASPRRFKGKKGAQEAHEAIRPTNFQYSPTAVKDKLDRDQLRLYELIWKRAIACQMTEAELDQTNIDIEIKNYLLRATGQIILFDGFRRVYIEGTDKRSDEEDTENNKDKILPKVEEGQELDLKNIDTTQHFTKPPARYTEASLVKKLESEGIGRPSTYAPTISTIIQRGYVEKESNKLHATNIGMLVTDFLVEHFSNIVDYKFTAKVEEELDDIAEGNRKWVPMISEFYDPFHKNIEDKSENVKREDVMKERIVGTDPESGKDIIARHGRYGPYVQIGEWSEEDRKEKKNQPRRASLPDGAFFETITLEEALKALSLPKSLGKIKGEEALVNVGPYGPYLKVGKTNVSLGEYKPHEITLAEAKTLFEEAGEKKKKFGTPLKVFEKKDPNSNEEIQIKRGRYGPYITDGKTNAAIPKGKNPSNISFDDAVELLEKKRKAPKKKWKKK
ncbi:type I DNA topoisomerase [Candidatus Peregrinibacteria bacterium]|jgi:DNA topoisomerase I|nr:type I DNA topoisomerase [Candidatus Peregrinibacteria bacterium]